MSLLTTDPEGVGQSLYSSQANPAHRIGERVVAADGRVFRYVKNGAVALVAGNVIQSPAQITNHQQLTPTQGQSVGDRTVTVTLGATAATANQYAGGYLIVDTTPGNGYGYRILSHPAANSGATLVLTLEAGSELQVAITTSSRISLQANPYNGVIQAPITTLTGIVVGVAVYPIAIGEYGWLQTHGVAPTLVAGTPAVGMAVSSPASAAGAAAINSSTLDIVGKIAVTGVDGKNQAVFLTID